MNIYENFESSIFKSLNVKLEICFEVSRNECQHEVEKQVVYLTVKIHYLAWLLSQLTIFDVCDVDGEVVVTEDDVTIMIQRGTEGEWTNVLFVLKQNLLPVDVEWFIYGKQIKISLLSSLNS